MGGGRRIEDRVCYLKKSSNLQEKKNRSKERSMVQRSNNSLGDETEGTNVIWCITPISVMKPVRPTAYFRLF